MNAIMQITEIHREQHQLHQERLARLWRASPQPAPQPVSAPITIAKVADKSTVAEHPSRGDIAARVLAARDERIRCLELDLADARARILSQAEMLCQLDEKILEDDEKRPVAIIVAEVLQDYPDVTWAEIKSIRRTERLVGPRQACVQAAFLQRPDLSSTQIGRIFAREHSSILHCIRKMAKEGKR